MPRPQPTTAPWTSRRRTFHRARGGLRIFVLRADVAGGPQLVRLVPERTVIRQLEQEGVNPGTFPLYMSYNTAWPVGDVTNLGNCCAAGYHNLTGVPLETQTYGAVDFDTTGFFAPGKNAGSGPGLNTEVAAHEVGEWMNDPFGNNQTAPWGGTGQVANCQANLEVGDPLTGNDVSAVTMPNGFTYNLQELAFFSWFYGGPSIGTGGLFSNNGTFTTDAGPNCPANNLTP